MANGLDTPPLDDLVALVPAARGAVVADAHGAARHADAAEARTLFGRGEVLVAHAAFVAGRLKTPVNRPVFDVLELFAFVRPGVTCVPSALGIARMLGLGMPQGAEETACTLHRSAALLLEELAEYAGKDRARVRALAETLTKAGWRWGPLAASALGEAESTSNPIAGMDTWRALPQWEDEAPPAKPGSLAVDPHETFARLKQLVGSGGEARPEQAAYAEAASFAFSPRERAGAPRIALLEAGTGTGKTLGYLAPASLWAEKNGPGLWISTYTRNLQRQIMQEIARLYPDPAERNEKAVVRKGRENYLCLLNFEEASKRVALAPGQRTIALGLIARWIGATPDGDLSGIGFPSFLAASLALRDITDRRGECIYAACQHYRTCFIERAIRRARNAPIVVANHALVIAQAAQDWRIDETTDTPDERRVRYVFDEGHHLFDAADSGFAALLSGSEMAELRRWIRGAEGRARTRMRGLEERLKDLVEQNEAARSALEEAVAAAGALAGEGWMSRASGGSARGPGETFLAEAHQHVHARSGGDADSFYSLEAETEPLGVPMLEAARRLSAALKHIAGPLIRLAQMLRKNMDENAKDLEVHQRARIEAAARGWSGAAS